MCFGLLLYIVFAIDRVKYITNKLHLSLNTETLLRVSPIIYSHLHETPICTNIHTRIRSSFKMLSE